MNYPSMVKYQNVMRSGGMLFLNSDLISEAACQKRSPSHRVPANSLAHDMGNDRVLNMVMLGAFTAVSGIVSEKAVIGAVATVLGGKKKLIEINQQAVTKGSQSVSVAGTT